MNNFLKVTSLLFALVLGLSSCQMEKFEIIDVQSLVRFDDEKANKQLGIDLLNYQYDLNDRFRHIAPEVLAAVSWDVFSSLADDETHFRIKLSNEAIKYKAEIESYFQQVTDAQIIKQLNDDNIPAAVVLAEKMMDYLDKGRLEDFWQYTSAELRSITTLEKFTKQIITGRKQFRESSGPRQLGFKLYYDGPAGLEGRDVYVANFTYKNVKQSMEHFTFVIEEGELALIGYNRRMPN